MVLPLKWSCDVHISQQCAVSCPLIPTSVPGDLGDSAKPWVSVQWTRWGSWSSLHKDPERREQAYFFFWISFPVQIIRGPQPMRCPMGQWCSDVRAGGSDAAASVQGCSYTLASESVLFCQMCILFFHWDTVSVEQMRSYKDRYQNVAIFKLNEILSPRNVAIFSNGLQPLNSLLTNTFTFIRMGQ